MLRRPVEPATHSGQSHLERLQQWDLFLLRVGQQPIERQMELPRGTKGAVVTEVDPDSQAARSLLPGDVILKVAGQSVSTASAS